MAKRGRSTKLSFGYLAATGPFERLPVCPCDRGDGPAPTAEDRFLCRTTGGPCLKDGRIEMANDK